MDAFKRQLVYSVLTPVFMPSLSMFHSLPNSKILLDETSRVVTKQRFWIYSARLEIYWQPARIGGDGWCSK